LDRLFDFTRGQIRTLALLTFSALILAGVLFVRKYALPTEAATPFPVIIGETNKPLTGIFLLDPNTAPADSLELLPGIGPVLADRIVAYRQNHRFQSEIDITEIKGIGPKLYEQIKPYLRIKR
jgi:competence ComEA-like helix-hairpin-helix protein